MAPTLFDALPERFPKRPYTEPGQSPLPTVHTPHGRTQRSAPTTDHHPTPTGRHGSLPLHHEPYPTTTGRESGNSAMPTAPPHGHVQRAPSSRTIPHNHRTGTRQFHPASNPHPTGGHRRPPLHHEPYPTGGHRGPPLRRITTSHPPQVPHSRIFLSPAIDNRRERVYRSQMDPRGLSYCRP